MCKVNRKRNGNQSRSEGSSAFKATADREQLKGPVGVDIKGPTPFIAHSRIHLLLDSFPDHCFLPIYFTYSCDSFCTSLDICLLFLSLHDVYKHLVLTFLLDWEIFCEQE